MHFIGRELSSGVHLHTHTSSLSSVQSQVGSYLKEWRKSTSGSLLSDAEEMVLPMWGKSFLFAECHIFPGAANSSSSRSRKVKLASSWFYCAPCGNDDTCLTLNLIQRKCGFGPATEFSVSNCGDC